MSTDPVVNIVGSGATRNDAPFSDPDALIWSTVSVAHDLARTDLAFDLHVNRYTPEELNKLPVKAFVLHESYRDKPVHDSTILPIDTLEKRYGKIFPGSMSIILAWAHYIGYHRVRLYGIDLVTESEYGEQRLLFMYLVGYLRGLGMDIEISEGSGLNDECPTYIYDKPRDTAMVKAEALALKTLEENNAKLTECRERDLYTRGFLEAVSVQKRSKGNGSYKRI